MLFKSICAPQKYESPSRKSGSAVCLEVSESLCPFPPFLQLGRQKRVTYVGKSIVRLKNEKSWATPSWTWDHTCTNRSFAKGVGSAGLDIVINRGRLRHLNTEKAKKVNMEKSRKQTKNMHMQARSHTLMYTKLRGIHSQPTWMFFGMLRWL